MPPCLRVLGGFLVVRAAAATKSFLVCPALQVSQQGPWTGQGATRDARGRGCGPAQVARERARAPEQAEVRARAGRRRPQRARPRRWRPPLYAAGAPAGERSVRAPGCGRRAARGPGAPHRRGSHLGSCRRALRTERLVRRRVGVGRGAGPGRGGSLTGRFRGAGGRRQLLQEAHGHFQDVRLLQLGVAGALRPATKERGRERTRKAELRQAAVGTALLPGAGCRARRGPQGVSLAPAAQTLAPGSRKGDPAGASRPPRSAPQSRTPSPAPARSAQHSPPCPAAAG